MGVDRGSEHSACSEALLKVTSGIPHEPLRFLSESLLVARKQFSIKREGKHPVSYSCAKWLLSAGKELPGSQRSICQGGIQVGGTASVLQVTLFCGDVVKGQSLLLPSLPSHSTLPVPSLKLQADRGLLCGKSNQGGARLGGFPPRQVCKDKS